MPIFRKGFFFIWKNFNPNLMKLSERVAKCIKIIMLKFKINTINIQKYVPIYSKYFLIAHASMTTKIFF